MIVTAKKLTSEQLNIVMALAKEVDVTVTTASILYKRGYDTAEKMLNYLNPSKKHFLNPFLLKGVSEAVERIKTAKLNGETVVVYGDYDVDGICGTTILTRALNIYGIQAVAVIPERENGYGLSEGVLNEVLEAYFPDLIITVDCGISAKNEVEYLKDLGVDVIVTDHHEVPPEIPDCTVINCHLQGQEYGFDGLCGAGVAYKLAYALLGADADCFIDLVALATIADSMPLINENRDLVFEGVNAMIKGRCNKAVKKLIEVSNLKEITAIGLVFSIIPRINAAGRMGNARLSLQMFLSDDEDEISDIAIALTKYNVDRQTECDELIKEVKRSLKGVKPNKFMVAYGENWKSGLLGIVASKICDEYNLPSLVLTEQNGVLHGSARSIDGVNVFEVLSSASDLLVDFGGHAQAAGVTIKKENLQKFIEKVNDFTNANYDDSVFNRVIEVEDFIEEKFSMRQAQEIKLFEPFGVANKKPVFAINVGKVNANKLKPDSTHLSINGTYIDLTYFNGVNDLDLLLSDAEKTIIFEPTISVFNNREYLKGYVKTIVHGVSGGNDFYLRALTKAFNGIAFKNYPQTEYLNNESVKKLFNEYKPSGYGALFVINNPKNAELFPEINNYSVNLLKLNERGGRNVVIIGGFPESDDFSLYDTVIHLDNPFTVEKYINFNKVISNGELNAFNLDGISVDRSALGKIFIEIKNVITVSNVKTIGDLYAKTNCDNINLFAFAFSVFTELEFITYNGVYGVNTSVKKDLTTSAIYNAVYKLINA